MGVAVAMKAQTHSSGSQQLSGEQPAPRRLRDNTLSSAERQVALWTHLSMPIVAVVTGAMLSFVPPLVLWLVRRHVSPFNDDHGREALNFFISYTLLHIALGITIIGVALWPVLWVVGLVSTIRGSMAAHRGEYFRYPMTIRFLS